MTIPQPPDILSAEFVDDPYTFHSILRDHYPVLYHEGTQCYVISRFADCAAAFRNPTFSNRNYEWQLEPVHGRTILQMEGRQHAMHRSLLSPFFRGDGLERFTPVIMENAARLMDSTVEKAAHDLIDQMPSSGPVDIVKEFATWFPINVIVDMLGLLKEDHATFHRWYVSVTLHLNNLAGDPDVTAQAQRTKQELEDYMLPIIRERRDGDGDDLLSRLCRAEVDGERMSDEDIKAFVSLLLVAGGETTDKSTASMVANLLANPDQLEQVRENRDLVDNVIAENLRHSGPVHMIMRQVEEDVEVSGTMIPAGSTCILLLSAANRDERQFANPDQFDINRDDLDVARAFSGAANHVQFTLGRHFCVGSLLARSEMRVALNTILDQMPGIRLAKGEQPKESGLYTRGIPSIMVEFDHPRTLATV